MVVREVFLGWASRHGFLDVSGGLSVKHTQLVAKESTGCQLPGGKSLTLAVKIAVTVY